MGWDQKRRPPSGYLHPAKVTRVLLAHQGVCHLCGHQGAEQVDHIIPWSQWTRTDLSVHHKSNLAPAHGAPCPVCGRHCHEDKSKAEAAAGRAASTVRKTSLRHRPVERHPGLI